MKIIELEKINNVKLDNYSINLYNFNEIFFRQTKNKYLLEKDNKIIGICEVFYENNIATIIGIEIDKEYRGHNIGVEFFSKLENIFKEKGINKIELNSKADRLEFYKRLGFNRTYEDYDEYTMVKDIKGKNK